MVLSTPSTLSTLPNQPPQRLRIALRNRMVKNAAARSAAPAFSRAACQFPAVVKVKISACTKLPFMSPAMPLRR